MLLRALPSYRYHLTRSVPILIGIGSHWIIMSAERLYQHLVMMDRVCIYSIVLQLLLFHQPLRLKPIHDSIHETIRINNLYCSIFRFITALGKHLFRFCLKKRCLYQPDTVNCWEGKSNILYYQGKTVTFGLTLWCSTRTFRSLKYKGPAHKKAW